MADQRIPEELSGDLEDFESGAAPGLFPGFPFFSRASGLYSHSFFIRRQPFPLQPQPFPQPIHTGPAQPAEETEVLHETAEFGSFPWFQNEELRLDVDGRYPQMTASGTIRHGLSVQIHWVANLSRIGRNTYSGSIWYKDGNSSLLPQTKVTIAVVRSWFAGQRHATVTFAGGGAATRIRNYRWRSWYFHPVEIELDRSEKTDATTVINTCEHPNRPAGLTCENLSIQTVFQRAGFDVRTSPGSGKVPIAGAGSNATWSDAELHDAMQTFWSHFADSAQWSMWTFFARQHDMGPNLGGIMFDDIGPNHRQGTAIFNNSFISDAPSGDGNPIAWVKRMQFWTAVHEMGHAFNLAHSWQKEFGTPWIALLNEPEARSFMNYPGNVIGGQSQFFSDFDFRFSDQELLFMRHAPARFVQMGNADWFDHHGFEQAERSPEPTLELEVRQHRSVAHYEFLEPISVELKLKNISREPQLVDKSILSEADRMTVVLKRQGKAARQWAPYAHRCYEPEKFALSPGEALYGTLRVASGLNGWDLAEPGIYAIQVVLHLEDEDVVSNSLRVQIAPPQNAEEELLAQDFFSEEVGRILAFDGSLYLAQGNDILREVSARLSNRNVALHARLAQAVPAAHGFKTLALGEDLLKLRADNKSIGDFKVEAANTKLAREELTAVLQDDSVKAVDTLGHIDYKQRIDFLSHFLAEGGDRDAAAGCQHSMHQLLAKRGVLKPVLDGIERVGKSYAKSKPTAA